MVHSFQGSFQIRYNQAISNYNACATARISELRVRTCAFGAPASGRGLYDSTFESLATMLRRYLAVEREPRGEESVETVGDACKLLGKLLTNVDVCVYFSSRADGFSDIDTEQENGRFQNEFGGFRR